MNPQEFIPLRQAVFELAALYGKFMYREPSSVIEHAVAAIYRSVSERDCEATAKYWLVSFYNSKRKKWLGSETHGTAVPPSLFSRLATAEKIHYNDWVEGVFAYTSNAEDGSSQHYATAKGIELNRRKLPLIGDDNISATFHHGEIDRIIREERRGARRKWDWDGAICEVLAHANSHPDGLPEGFGAQAKIGKLLTSWFRDNQGGEPAQSEIGARAAKIMKAIETHRK